MRKFIALAMLAVLARPALAADLPNGLDSFRYSTELKLAIATAISPRTPPITMHVNRSFGTRRPIIFGTTNLPDGAILQVNLEKPLLPDAQERLSIGLPACKDNCIGTGDRVIIKNGAFRTGPLSFGTANPLEPGVYPLEIVLETGQLNANFVYPVYTGQIIIGR